ncbi:hypothetical protein [Helicobacter sp. 12S02232-10]|nr:hypothetical protein [Helicobacter sp. 12S02232-10]
MQEKSDRKKQAIPVMFCFDKNYVIPASVAFYSLLKNAGELMGGGV